MESAQATTTTPTLVVGSIGRESGTIHMRRLWETATVVVIIVVALIARELVVFIAEVAVFIAVVAVFNEEIVVVDGPR